jgi:FixJ family two-component response regulator
MADNERLVLVVDDDASMRHSTDCLIRSIGLRVETFASADQFLKHQRPDRPACLVLDMRMLGLSGLDLSRNWRLFKSRRREMFGYEVPKMVRKT